ncbi:MAG: acyl-CoA dehydrogenase family protein [Acidimicrobiia bacterium]|nr:acyl-CoA dehydrogenase family protein [Acidimicrobiia bacterium]
MGDLRTEVRAWLDDNWDESRTLGDWWKALAEAGLGYPSWPEEWYGRGLTTEDTKMVRAELRAAGAYGAPSGVGPFLAAPTMLVHGTENQKRRFMPGIAMGTDVWCQLFSEPGSGSDLASLSTRAVRDGDEWIVNGQKVWNTGAQYADYGILVARTDPDQPKHKGLSYFLIDMRQEGVEVRPLKEMSGDSTFNEVFFSDARVPVDNQLGPLGEGWRVTMTTLMHERDTENPASGAGGAFVGRPRLDATIAEVRVEAASAVEDGLALSMGGGIIDQLMELAEEFGATADPVVRQELMRIHCLREVLRFTGLRIKAAVAAGGQPGPESSTGKLMQSEIGRRIRDLAWRIEGPYGQLVGPDAPRGGVMQKYGLFQPAMSIAGGTDEIQRNIIGERVLGLPKEPDVSRDVPWRDLVVGTQR